MSRQCWLTRWLSLGIAVALATPALADSTDDTNGTSALDPLQWAVVDSLRYPERTTPQELLEAAIRAASVEAIEPTLEFLDKFDDALRQSLIKKRSLQHSVDIFRLLNSVVFRDF